MDAAPAHDAPLDHGIDARRMDSAAGDAHSGGLPCPQSPSLANACPATSPSVSACVPTWDAIASDTQYCRNGQATSGLVVTGTCGDLRILEDNRVGDEVLFYYYDTSGALIAIVSLLENRYQCMAGSVTSIEAPCTYLDSPSVTRLVCSTDAGALD